jgi:hypothetical protein
MTSWEGKTPFRICTGKDRQTEGGSEFLDTKYYQGVNISGRTALMLTLGRSERAQLFCGPLRGWPQEAALCWTPSGLVHCISQASAISPSTRSFPYSDPEIHLMNSGKQTVLLSRSALRSFAGSCGYPAHHSWRHSIKVHFLEFNP